MPYNNYIQQHPLFKKYNNYKGIEEECKWKYGPFYV